MSNLVSAQVFEVSVIMGKERVSLGDLFLVGDYLDDPATAKVQRRLTADARLFAEWAIREYLQAGEFDGIANTCERSWALSDLYFKVLGDMEEEINLTEMLGESCGL